jgi:hypothetical protein
MGGVPMAYREVTDRSGRAWKVWDTYPGSEPRVSVSEEMLGGWLTFECADEKRRLARPPEDWAVMTEGELLGLLAGAGLVRPS